MVQCCSPASLLLSSQLPPHHTPAPTSGRAPPARCSAAAPPSTSSGCSAGSAASGCPALPAHRQPLLCGCAPAIAPAAAPAAPGLQQVSGEVGRGGVGWCWCTGVQVLTCVIRLAVQGARAAASSRAHGSPLTTASPLPHPSYSTPPCPPARHAHTFQRADAVAPQLQLLQAGQRVQALYGRDLVAGSVQFCQLGAAQRAQRRQRPHLQADRDRDEGVKDSQ